MAGAAWGESSSACSSAALYDHSVRRSAVITIHSLLLEVSTSGCGSAAGNRDVKGRALAPRRPCHLRWRSSGGTGGITRSVLFQTLLAETVSSSQRSPWVTWPGGHEDDHDGPCHPRRRRRIASRPAAPCGHTPALPQPLRWTVQRTIFHLLDEPVPTLADPFPATTLCPVPTNCTCPLTT